MERPCHHLVPLLLGLVGRAAATTGADAQAAMTIGACVQAAMTTGACAQAALVAVSVDLDCEIPCLSCIDALNDAHLNPFLLTFRGTNRDLVRAGRRFRRPQRRSAASPASVGSTASRSSSKPTSMRSSSPSEAYALEAPTSRRRLPSGELLGIIVIFGNHKLMKVLAFVKSTKKKIVTWNQ
ncbi:hypothetical protein EJB05_33901, partial [Eragrostis curvula]